MPTPDSEAIRIDFSYFPRAVGNPMQHVINTGAEFEEFVRANNGKAPVFTSHNAYPTLDEKGNPSSVHFRNLSFDLDSKEKPENALLDAIKLYQWGLSKGLPTWVNYSGSKGFHVYFLFKPETYELDEKFRAALRAVQVYLINLLGIRTADNRTIGDAKRLMRVPYTRHVSYDGAKMRVGEKFCCPVPEDMLLRASIREIEGWARRPGVVRRLPVQETSYTLRSFISQEKIDLRALHDQPLHDVKYAEYLAPSLEIVKLLFPRPCIAGNLMKLNPVHEVRFEAAVMLRFMGYDESFAQKFFDDVAQRAGWVDREFAHRRQYQVHHLFTHQPPYRPFKCSKLKAAGACIGAKCPIFFETNGAWNYDGNETRVGPGTAQGGRSDGRASGPGGLAGAGGLPGVGPSGAMQPVRA